MQLAGTSLIVFPLGPTDRQWEQKDRKPGIEQEGSPADMDR